MMRIRNELLVLAFLVAAPSASVTAASLQVRPVFIEVRDPQRAAQLSLMNLSDDPVNAQIRVFRWTQNGGEEQLIPTTDVVASPPAATLTPGQDHVVRLVRVSREPLEHEEAYRLIIDELPGTPSDEAVTVSFMMRYSIPVFFYDDNSSPLLSWTAETTEGQLRVKVTNNGMRHARVSALIVKGQSGGSVSFGDGLIGYVLPGSTMEWRAPAGNLIPGEVLNIVAQGREGQFNAAAMIEPGQGLELRPSLENEN